MTTTTKPSKKKASIAAGLAAAAAGRETPEPATDTQATKADKPKLVMIGGMFPPEVRRVLLLVQAEPQNQGKNLKTLLGEAINDLCAKYNKPQPYTGDV